MFLILAGQAWLNQQCRQFEKAYDLIVLSHLGPLETLKLARLLHLAGVSREVRPPSDYVQGSGADPLRFTQLRFFIFGNCNCTQLSH